MKGCFTIRSYSAGEHRLLCFAGEVPKSQPPTETKKEIKDEISMMKMKEKNESYEYQRNQRAAIWIRGMGFPDGDIRRQMNAVRGQENKDHEQFDIYEKDGSGVHGSRRGSITSDQKEFSQTEFVTKMLNEFMLSRTRFFLGATNDPDRVKKENTSRYAFEYSQLLSYQYLEPHKAEIERNVRANIEDHSMDIAKHIDVSEARSAVPMGCSAIGIMYKGKYLGDILEKSPDTKPQKGHTPTDMVLNPCGVRASTFLDQGSKLLLEEVRPAKNK